MPRRDCHHQSSPGFVAVNSFRKQNLQPDFHRRMQSPRCFVVPKKSCKTSFAVTCLAVTILVSTVYSSWALARPHVSKTFSNTFTRFDRCSNLGKMARAACHGRSTSSGKSDGMLGFREYLKLQDGTADHLVLGNEAGDADSIVSAMTLAYVDSFVSSKSPVISINRADMNLRRETVLLLELAGVDVNDLVFIDDLEGGVTKRRKVTLVDHNRLADNFRPRFDVVEIIDHHEDGKNHASVVGDARDIAFANGKALVASTCTLVVERMKYLKPPYSPDLTLPLLGVILLDSANMSASTGKGTARDQAAIDEILQHTDWSLLSEESASLYTDDSRAPDTTKLYKRLSESKFDPTFWNELSVTDALRLDYKRFQGGNAADVFGASTVLLPLSSFLAKADLVKSLQNFLEQSQIPLLAVMSACWIDGKPQRELLLCGKEQLVADMSSFLLHNKESEYLELEEVKPNFAEKNIPMRQFRQRNGKASRKQVAPIMLRFFNQD